MFGNNVSLADIAAVTNNRNNDNGFGNDWWAWIIFIALFGWGGMGGMWGNGMMGMMPWMMWGMPGMWNNGTGSNGQFVEAAVQRGFDNQTVINKLDGISNGLCSLGYDQLSQMNGIGNTIQQVGWNLQQTMNQNEMANMQRAFAAQQQASDCCCENRVGQMNIINQMDRNNCATNTAIQQLGQQMMWAQQQGFRDISDQMNAGFAGIERSQLMRENAELRQQVNDANRVADLQAQSNYIINAINPRSNPAYLTCNPNTGNVFPQSGIDQWRYANFQANALAAAANQNNCNTCCNNGYNGF